MRSCCFECKLMLIHFEIPQTWLTVVTLQNKWLVREYTSKQHHHPYNLVNTMSPAKSSDRSCLHSISALYLGTHRLFFMSSHSQKVYPLCIACNAFVLQCSYIPHLSYPILFHAKHDDIRNAQCTTMNYVL